MAILIGTVACEPGTLAGEIHAGFENLYGVDAAASATVKGVAFSIAQGVYEGLRTQIADTEAIVRDGSTLTGGAGGGGGGAPADAEYIVATSDGTLTAERVATDTATVTWDFATIGQAKANVVDGTTSTKGAVRLATDGDATSGRAVQGTDSRLTDAREPTAHATTHKSGGSDAIAIDTLAAPSDITTLNASTSAHGLLRKLPGTSGTFLDGNGQFVIPSESPTDAYELDWTGLSTQAGLGDGNVTVDGVNWTADNTANSSLFQILNGSGLQITAAAGVSRTWTGSTRTSPALFVAFEDIAAAAAKYHLTLTVWSYFSAWSLPNSQNAIIMGCYAPAGAVYTTVVSAAGFLNNGVSNFPYIQRSATFTAATALGPSYDVLVWRFLPGGSVDAWCGSWSAGWPTALTPIGSDNQPSGSTIVTTAQIRRAGSTVIYSPATRSASGAPSFTLARTRIQIG